MFALEVRDFRTKIDKLSEQTIPQIRIIHNQMRITDKVKWQLSIHKKEARDFQPIKTARFIIEEICEERR